MKKIKLATDNALPRIEVVTSVGEVEYTCKVVLGWRSPTKKYNTIFERFKATGSSNYDKVIKHIYDLQN